MTYTNDRTYELNMGIISRGSKINSASVVTVTGDYLLHHTAVTVINRTLKSLIGMGILRQKAETFITKYPHGQYVCPVMVSELYMIAGELPELRKGLRALHKCVSAYGID